MRHSHLLVDAHNLLYRSGHSVGHLTLSDGTPCGAAWGFIRSLLAAYRSELGATGGKVHVVWDGGLSSRRLELLPTYKTGRHGPADPDDWKAQERREERQTILAQADMIKTLLLPSGVAQYEGKGVEADDVIAVLSQSLENDPSAQVVILSGDDDFRQLVRPNVTLVSPSRRLYAEDVPWPREAVTAKAIAGCRSDKISGLPGVGENTAEKLLAWIHRTASQGTCVECADLGRWLEINTENGQSPTGRVKTAVRAISESFCIIERNAKLVDLSLPFSQEWPEVWDVALNPQVGQPDSRQFIRGLLDLGWGGLIKQEAEILALVRGDSL